MQPGRDTAHTFGGAFSDPLHYRTPDPVPDRDDREEEDPIDDAGQGHRSTRDAVEIHHGRPGLHLHERDPEQVSRYRSGAATTAHVELRNAFIVYADFLGAEHGDR